MTFSHTDLAPGISPGAVCRSYEDTRLYLNILVCLIFIFASTGCEAGSPAVSPQPSPTQAARAVENTPGKSPTPSYSLTPSQPQRTPIPSPSATVFPSFSSSPPSPSVTAAPLGCWAQGGRMEAGSLETSLLRQPLEYLVYLPACYDDQPERSYPVLYLIHGQSYNQDQWDRLGADEAADRLSAAREIPPFIIVMPRDRVWSQPTEDLFGQAVVEVLIPYVDRTYRTLSDRKYRAVGGLSRGGGWAVHLGITHPELFGALGGHSPAIFHTDTARMRSWLDGIAAEDLPRIYLDIGDKDRPEILRSALWLENLLTEKRISHEWHLFSGYHEEAYWSAHVEGYLRWYAEDWWVEGFRMGTVIIFV